MLSTAQKCGLQLCVPTRGSRYVATFRPLSTELHSGRPTHESVQDNAPHSHHTCSHILHTGARRVLSIKSLRSDSHINGGDAAISSLSRDVATLYESARRDK